MWQQFQPKPLDHKRAFCSDIYKFVRFVKFKRKIGGQISLGAQIADEGDIIDLSSIDKTIPDNVTDFLKQGWTFSKICRILTTNRCLVRLRGVDLYCPIMNPGKIICVENNYKEQCAEEKVTYPKEPVFTCKFPSSLIGPSDNIILPKISLNVDYGLNLGVLIGKEAKQVRIDKARSYIFGYTIAQDICARDWERDKNNGQFIIGKSMDTFCPVGPSVVPKECVDTNDLYMSGMLNGTSFQEGRTSDMLFSIEFLVSYLSHVATLNPGDLILTGTPAGVGWLQNPPRYLKDSDLVQSEILGIGKMTNKVVSVNDEVCRKE